MRSATLTLAGVMLAGTAASAQDVLDTINVGGNGYALGVDCRADFDGDGHADIVIGKFWDSCGFEGVYSHGQVLVYSPVRSATLLEVSSILCGDAFGYAALAIDDLDGDGVPEVLASANGDYPYVTNVKAVSGATGSTLYRAPVPMSPVIDFVWDAEGHTTLDTLGDVDGDGLGDFAATTTTGARVCSGRDGSTIAEIPASSTQHSQRNSVVGLGDVDLDGIPDVAVSDLKTAVGSSSRVLVCSARTGELLFQLEGEPVPPGGYWLIDSFGQCLAAPGDVDGDGHPDLLVSMIVDSSPEQSGVVRALSGVDGSLIFGVPTEKVSSEDVTVRRLGDLDGDGFPDLMLSVWKSQNPRVEVWSARTASQLMSFEPDGSGYWAFGAILDTLGDFDRDGVPDLLAGTGSEMLVLAGHPGVEPTLVQPTVLSVSGAAGDRLGASLARLGDLDGDGREDFACGAPGGAGAVRLVSGHHGDTLTSFAGTELDADFGGSLALAGDLDGDGLADLLVGAPRADSSGTDAGAVQMLSMSTGAALWSASGLAAGDRFGSALAAVGDVNLDGVPDVLVGAPLADAPLLDSGAAWLLDGASGAVLRSWAGTATEDEFGRGVTGPGDIDGDGTPDLAVGAPLVNGPGTGADNGRVLVLSGASGGVLLSIDATGVNSGFGWSLAAPGDHDDDGVPDLLVGSPGTQLLLGRALIISGADASELLSVGKGLAAKLGRAVATADMDGDGRPDLLAGAPNGSPNSAAVAFAADDCDVLVMAKSLAGAEFLGAAVCAADVNGDGNVDLVAGAPDAGGGAGRIDVVSMVPQWTSIPGGFAGQPGVAGAGGYPLLAGSGTLVPGGDVSVHLGSAAPHAVGRLFAGTGIAFASFKGGVLVPQPIVVQSFLTDGGGQQTWSAAWPAGLPAGSSVYLQAWILDAAAVQGVAGSNGLQGHVP